VIGEFSFYGELTLRKSQADAMLNRLAKEWLPEFDSLCQLRSVCRKDIETQIFVLVRNRGEQGYSQSFEPGRLLT
jgi:hypothetical protein